MGIIHKNSTSSGLGAPAATAETVVYVTPVIQAGPGQVAVGISGTMYVTAGTSATAITVRCRQGTNGGVGATGPTGTQVGPSEAITVVAGSQYAISFGFTDTSPYLSGPNSQYAITVQQTAGGAAGNSNAIDIEVLV